MDSDKNNTVDLVDFGDVDVEPYISCMDDTTFSFDNDTIVLSSLEFNDYTNNMSTNHASGTITLSGPDSDINIDGMSLKQTLQSLNDRLAILEPNPELEAEFDELHALAEQYRALEQKIIEKKKVWTALNKT